MKDVNIRRLERRATKTLIAWWDEFNGWGWPDGFGPEDRSRCSMIGSRRMVNMNAIQMELGRRVIFNRPMKKPPSPAAGKET